MIRAKARGDFTHHRRLTMIHGFHCRRCARQRLRGEVSSMGIAGCIPANGAQTKTLRAVLACMFKPPVIKHIAFRMAGFKKQLAIIGAAERLRQQGAAGGKIERKLIRNRHHSLYP
jgi:hypothetical protein